MTHFFIFSFSHFLTFKLSIMFFHLTTLEVVKTCAKAAVIALSSLEWIATANANIENTSIRVRWYLIPPYCLAIFCISAK